MNDKGTMAKGKELFNFSKKHRLKIGKIEDLIAYRLNREKLIKHKKTDHICCYWSFNREYIRSARLRIYQAGMAHILKKHPR